MSIYTMSMKAVEALSICRSNTMRTHEAIEPTILINNLCLEYYILFY